MTELVLAQRQRLCGELASRGFDAHSLIVADDENLDIARRYGSETVEAPNRRLGEKCNIGLRHAGAAGADWIVWIGSDDWVHPDVFDPILDEPELSERSLPPILLGHRLIVLDLKRGVLRRSSSPSRFGAIPWIIHRRRLERVGFAPLRRDLGRGLDGALIRGLKKARVAPAWHYYNPHEFRCVDFKSEVNLNSYELVSRLGVQPEEPAWEALAERYPADLVERARRTHLEMAA